MRVVLLGYGEIATATLRAVRTGGFTVTGVLTHRPGPSEQNPLEAAARAEGLPVSTASVRSSEAQELLHRAAPDVIVSVNYRSIVPPSILRIPSRGAINVHGSLLPKYRGRTPAVWAIINGEEKTGITIHYMAPEVDAGDIILQEEIPLTLHDTAGKVVERFVERVPVLVVKALRFLDAGTVAARPQDHAGATYGGRRTPEDGRIPWAQPARRVYDWIRALTHPYPGAFTSLRGRRVWIWDASLLDDAEAPLRRPGSVAGVQIAVRRPQCGLIVAASPGRLVVHWMQFEGESEVEAYSLWEQGFVKVGDLFE